MFRVGKACNQIERKRPVENKIGNHVREKEGELMECGPKRMELGLNLTL